MALSMYVGMYGTCSEWKCFVNRIPALYSVDSERCLYVLTSKFVCDQKLQVCTGTYMCIYMPRDKIQA